MDLCAAPAVPAASAPVPTTTADSAPVPAPAVPADPTPDAAPAPDATTSKKRAGSRPKVDKLKKTKQSRPTIPPKLTKTTAAQIRAQIRQVNCKKNVNANLDLIRLVPQLVQKKVEHTDFTRHLEAYREMVRGKVTKKAPAGLKNFTQFKYFAEKMSASMKNPNDILNDFTRFSRSDVGRVIVLMMRDRGYSHAVKIEQCFINNINIFLINFVARIGQNMLLLAHNMKRTLASNCDLALLQVLETNYGNYNCELEITSSYYSINSALPSIDRIHKSIFHYMFMELSRKPTTLDEMVDLMNQGDPDIMALYNSKITQNGFDCLRLIIYRFIHHLVTNVYHKVSEADLNLEEHPLSWAFFKENFDPKFYEFTTCVLHIMDKCNADNLWQLREPARPPKRKPAKSREVLESSDDD